MGKTRSGVLVPSKIPPPPPGCQHHGAKCSVSWAKKKKKFRSKPSVGGIFTYMNGWFFMVNVGLIYYKKDPIHWILWVGLKFKPYTPWNEHNLAPENRPKLAPKSGNEKGTSNHIHFFRCELAVSFREGKVVGVCDDIYVGMKYYLLHCVVYQKVLLVRWLQISPSKVTQHQLHHHRPPRFSSPLQPQHFKQKIMVNIFFNQIPLKETKATKNKSCHSPPLAYIHSNHNEIFSVWNPRCK